MYRLSIMQGLLFRINFLSYLFLSLPYFSHLLFVPFSSPFIFFHFIYFVLLFLFRTFTSFNVAFVPGKWLRMNEQMNEWTNPWIEGRWERFRETLQEREKVKWPKRTLAATTFNNLWSWNQQSYYLKWKHEEEKNEDSEKPCRGDGSSCQPQKGKKWQLGYFPKQTKTWRHQGQQWALHNSESSFIYSEAIYKPLHGFSHMTSTMVKVKPEI